MDIYDKKNTFGLSIVIKIFHCILMPIIKPHFHNENSFSLHEKTYMNRNRKIKLKTYPIHKYISSNFRDVYFYIIESRKISVGIKSRENFKRASHAFHPWPVPGFPAASSRITEEFSEINLEAIPRKTREPPHPSFPPPSPRFCVFAPRPVFRRPSRSPAV